MTLSSIAPRLARARDEYLAEQAERAAEAAQAAVRAGILADRLLHKQWLVEHRELQLIRAYSTGNPRYIAQRERKWQQAKRELAEVQARVEALA